VSQRSVRTVLHVPTAPPFFSIHSLTDHEWRQRGVSVDAPIVPHPLQIRSEIPVAGKYRLSEFYRPIRDGPKRAITSRRNDLCYLSALKEYEVKKFALLQSYQEMSFEPPQPGHIIEMIAPS
jgi:hypothetical protein